MFNGEPKRLSARWLSSVTPFALPKRLEMSSIKPNCTVWVAGNQELLSRTLDPARLFTNMAELLTSLFSDQDILRLSLGGPLRVRLGNLWVSDGEAGFHTPIDLTLNFKPTKGASILWQK
jgi:hypothetical protein